MRQEGACDLQWAEWAGASPAQEVLEGEAKLVRVASRAVGRGA